MAIILKNSATAAAVPTAGQLVLGEVAVNSADGKLYLKKGDGTVVAFLDEAASRLNPTYTGTVLVNGTMRASTTIDAKVTLTASTASTALDTQSAGVFKVNIAANTAFSFTNLPAAGVLGANVLSFTLITKNDATAGRAVSFPANVKWSGGTIPTRTTAANATDVWSFYTEDAGVTWIGSLNIADGR
jgi:hypothetical protein